MRTLSGVETQNREKGAVLAMAYERLGRHSEALNRLITLNMSPPLTPPSPENKDLERLVRESESLISAKNRN